MTSSKCPHCGAAFTGLICDYCGAQAGIAASLEEQRQALDELHQLIVNSPREKQALLLKGGYLPDDAGLLIDAGLKCVSMINNDEVRPGRSDAACGRLEAIILKLQLRPQDDEITKALALFRERLNRNRRDKSLDTRRGLLLLGAIAAAVALLLFLRC